MKDFAGWSQTIWVWFATKLLTSLWQAVYLTTCSVVSTEVSLLPPTETGSGGAIFLAIAFQEKVSQVREKDSPRL